MPVHHCFLAGGLGLLPRLARCWVYGPHGRKCTIGELPETREEAVFQRRGLGSPGQRLGTGALRGTRATRT